MYHENGVRTFYKGIYMTLYRSVSLIQHQIIYVSHIANTGLSAALISIAPQAGIQFTSYHFLSTIWNTMIAGEVKVTNTMQST